MDEPYAAPTAPPRGNRWVWPVLGGCGLLILICVALLIWFFYRAAQGPETDVYTGNEVPREYFDTMKELGAIEPDERVDYFYSDSFAHIRDGFYFVSDRRVVVYSAESGAGSLTAVPFADIADVRLDREESFFVDSQVTLKLKDGRIVSFPLSSEHEGDVHFVETIRERVGPEVESEAP